MAPVVCVACAQSLPNSRNRRRLQKDPDRQTLKEVVSRVYLSAVSVFLPPGGSTIDCLGRLEKLQKLFALATGLGLGLALSYFCRIWRSTDENIHSPCHSVFLLRSRDSIAQPSNGPFDRTLTSPPITFRASLGNDM